MTRKYTKISPKLQEKIRKDITFISKDKLIKKYNISERNYYYQRKEILTGIKGYKFEPKRVKKRLKKIERKGIKEKLSKQKIEEKKIKYQLEIENKKRFYKEKLTHKKEIYKPKKPKEKKEIKVIQKFIYDKNIKRAKRKEFVNVEMHRFITGKYYLIVDGIIDNYPRTFVDENIIIFITKRKALKEKIQKYLTKEQNLFKALILRNNLYEYNGFVFFNNIDTNERLLTYKFSD